jgi:ADP-ribosylglycohydrolase
VEFRTADDIRQEYPGGLRHLIDGGTWDILAGQPTDDSELALMLARTLVHERRFDATSVLQSYVHWYRSDPFDIGTTTSAALRAAAAAKTPEDGVRAAAEHANHDSQANGSLMRVSPLGVLCAHAPATAAEFARQDSCLTHPNPVCQDACAIFTIALATAIADGCSPRECHEIALQEAERLNVQPTVQAALVEARTSPPDDYHTHQGWVLIALQNAFHQLLHAPDLEQGIVRTVMSGGDTDTNAAIAGALLGAVHGRDAMPPAWRKAILSCRPLKGTATRHPRPMEFWPVDAIQLAEALLVAGEEENVLGH